METLDQIETREAAHRERAWQYGRVTGQVSHLKRQIERLTPKLPAQDATIALLDQIAELALGLPEECIGVMGYIARDQIRGACLAGKQGELSRRDQIAREIAACKSQLPALETFVATLEAEAG